jgi:hypothetical protein
MLNIDKSKRNNGCFAEKYRSNHELSLRPETKNQRPVLFVAQGFDRIEVGSFDGGEHATHDPDKAEDGR